MSGDEKLENAKAKAKAAVYYKALKEATKLADAYLVECEVDWTDLDRPMSM